MRLRGRGHDNQSVAIDYMPPMGEGDGLTSLELLLISLASCSSHSIQFVLGTMKHVIADIRADATGHRRMDQHPTVLTRVDLAYEISCDGLTEEAANKAVQMAEEMYCPVWAMLKGSVEIAWTCVVKPQIGA
jgi:putative redox protein